ncbi:hypothetical protein ANTRET_LOCUS7563 [Anthophora retusa]
MQPKQESSQDEKERERKKKGWGKEKKKKKEAREEEKGWGRGGEGSRGNEMEQFRDIVRDRGERHVYGYEKIRADFSQNSYYFQKKTARGESTSQELFCFFSSHLSELPYRCFAPVIR